MHALAKIYSPTPTNIMIEIDVNINRQLVLNCQLHVKLFIVPQNNSENNLTCFSPSIASS